MEINFCEFCSDDFVQKRAPFTGFGMLWKWNLLKMVKIWEQHFNFMKCERMMKAHHILLHCLQAPKSSNRGLFSLKISLKLLNSCFSEARWTTEPKINIFKWLSYNKIRRWNSKGQFSEENIKIKYCYTSIVKKGTLKRQNINNIIMTKLSLFLLLPNKNRQ